MANKPTKLPNALMKEHKNSIILTTCSPEKDPRSLHWARSCYAYTQIPTTVAYPIRSIRYASQIFSNIVPGQVNRLAVNLDSFSSNGFNGIDFGMEGSLFSEVMLRVRSEQQKDDKSPIHRTLLDQCLDQMTVALFVRSYFARKSIVVATDIQGLFASVAFDGFCDKIIYDAQEITVYGFPGLREREVIFWLDLEKILLTRKLDAVTVSPAIAKWQSEQFEHSFRTISNFEPLEIRNVMHKDATLPVKFVYYGGCAEEKNLESILNAWTISCELATLFVIAPKSAERRKLENIWRRFGRNNSVVEFQSHDDATSVTKYLTQFDVGVLPYAYSYPYSEASPNKFGQYLAAGLAVFGNRQGFVSELILDRNLGIVTDFANTKETQSEIERFVDLKFLNECKENSQISYDFDLNWDFQVNLVKNIFETTMDTEQERNMQELSYRIPLKKISQRVLTSPAVLLEHGILKLSVSPIGSLLIRVQSSSRLARRIRGTILLWVRGQS
jgi:glycosyltransferase involved in cell wall biosynthesis